MSNKDPRDGHSDKERLDAIFKEVLDELYATPLTEDQIAENRRLDPKGAKIVDELRELFGPDKAE